MADPTALGPQTAGKVARHFERDRRPGTQVHRPDYYRDNESQVGIKIVQATNSNGVPAIDGATPGRAQCWKVVEADQDYSSQGIQKGDLVRTDETIIVKNAHETPLGRFGKRLILVDSHAPEAWAINSTCENDATGDPSDILQQPNQSANQG